MSLELTETQQDRLNALLSLTDEQFNNLLGMVSLGASSAKRWTVMTPPSYVQQIIQECSMGQEVWWDYMPVSATVQGIDPLTGAMSQMQQAMLQIVLGMRGLVLGPENYVYYTIATDAIPDKDRLRNAVMKGMEYMRGLRAAQANDQQPSGGPQ